MCTLDRKMCAKHSAVLLFALLIRTSCEGVTVTQLKFPPHIEYQENAYY